MTKNRPWKLEKACHRWYFWTRIPKKRPLFVGVFEPKFPNEKTKLDFFPIGKIGIRNVPNFNNFISSEPHMSQFWARSENLFWPKKVEFFKVNRIFFQLENSKSRMFQIQINLYPLNPIWANFEQDQRTFCQKKSACYPCGIWTKMSNYPQFSEQKWIFFHFPKKFWNIFQIITRLHLRLPL